MESIGELLREITELKRSVADVLKGQAEENRRLTNIETAISGCPEDKSDTGIKGEILLLKTDSVRRNWWAGVSIVASIGGLVTVVVTIVLKYLGAK